MAYSMAQGIASFGESIGRGLEIRGKNKKRREFVLGRLGSINEEKEEDYMDAVAEFEASPQSESDQATLQAKADELQKWHKLTDDSQSTGKLEGALAEFDAEEDRQMNDLRMRVLEAQAEATEYELGQKKDPKSHFNKMQDLARTGARLSNRKAKRAIQTQRDAEKRMEEKLAASGLVGGFLSGTEEQVEDSREVTDPAEFETRYKPVPVSAPESKKEKPAFSLEDLGTQKGYQLDEAFNVPRVLVPDEHPEMIYSPAPQNILGNWPLAAVDKAAEFGRHLFSDREERLDESYNFTTYEVNDEKVLKHLADWKAEHTEAGESTGGALQTKVPVYRRSGAGAKKIDRYMDLPADQIKMEDISDFLNYANAKVDASRAVANATARTKAALTETDEGKPLPPAMPGYEYTRERVQTKGETTRQVPFMRDKTDEEIKDELNKLMTSPEVSKLPLEDQAKFKENVEKMLYGNLRKHDFGGTELIESTKTGSVTVLKKTEVESMEKAMQLATAMGMIPEEYSVNIGGKTIKFVPQQAGGGSVKRTEQEANSYVFSSRMVANEYLLEQMLGEGLDPSTFEMYVQQFVGADGKKINPLNFPEIARTPKAKAYIAAVDNWIEAALRKVSGAAIAHHEYTKYRTVFFPLINDSQETMDNKARLRNILTKSYMENANIADIHQQRGKWIHEMRTGQIWPGQGVEASSGLARYRTEQEAFAAGAQPGERVLMWDADAGVHREWDMEATGPVGSTDNALSNALQSAIEAGDDEEIVRILEQAGRQGG